VTLGQIIYRKK